jgi:hypothetical protein
VAALVRGGDGLGVPRLQGRGRRDSGRTQATDVGMQGRVGGEGERSWIARLLVLLIKML